MSAPDPVPAVDAEGDGTTAARPDHEKLEQVFAEMLQELRIMQTGAQLTGGFLLTLPFQQSFSHLDHLQRVVYLVLVVLAGLTTALVLTPVAIHRRQSGNHVKRRVVRATRRLAGATLACLASLIAGITFLVFDVVEGRAAGISVAAAVAVVLVTLLVGLPSYLLKDRD